MQCFSVSIDTFSCEDIFLPIHGLCARAIERRVCGAIVCVDPRDRLGESFSKHLSKSMEDGN